MSETETPQGPGGVRASLLSRAPGLSCRTVKPEVQTKLRERGAEANPSSSGRCITKAKHLHRETDQGRKFG